MLQDSTISLFKANMTKKQRTKNRQKGERTLYDTKFGRVLTQELAQKQKKKKEQNVDDARFKKKVFDLRKLNAFIKKKRSKMQKLERS